MVKMTPGQKVVAGFAGLGWLLIFMWGVGTYLGWEPILKMIGATR